MKTSIDTDWVDDFEALIAHLRTTLRECPQSRWYDLAARSGVSLSTITVLARQPLDNANPTLRTIRALAKALYPEPTVCAATPPTGESPRKIGSRPGSASYRGSLERWF